MIGKVRNDAVRMKVRSFGNHGVLRFAAIFFGVVANLILVSRDALALERVRVALSTKDFGYLALFVGTRANYFRDEGLEVQWIQVNPNVIITALLGGELDVAAAAGSAQRAAVRGAPLKSILFSYYKSTFVLLGAPQIKSVKDLKGKVIGTTGPGSSTELAASVVVQHYGLNPKSDVTFLNIGGAESSVAAMQQGVIQARAFNPDAAFVLKKKGFTELATLADLGPWPWAGYTTSVQKLTQERDKIKRWMRAMVKSLVFMLNRREETIRIVQAEFGYPRDIIEPALEVTVKAINAKDPGGIDDETLRKNIEMTIVQPMKLSEAPALSKLVDLSLLREVQAELGIRGK